MDKKQNNIQMSFPNKIQLIQSINLKEFPIFAKVWKDLMDINCHGHKIWESDFVKHLATIKETKLTFQLAATWSINMISGSFCFPRYVSALAARAELDAVRHGLLENAWDESGSHGHTSRSHFWLAVKLARLLKLDDEKIEKTRPIKESLNYTNEHFNQCANGEFDFALGMICLIEEFTTPEFTLILKAFLRSVEDELKISREDFILNGGAEYFTANIADDERHREEMPAIVATLLKTKGVDLSNEEDIRTGLKNVEAGVRYSADLREKFFNGIYEFVNGGGKYTSL